jgi:hypothetical protein
MVALRAKQARKMTEIASALPTPNQPSRDHEVVTQRLPEGDRPRRSRGVRTRHGGTKLGGRDDRSGWGGGRRRRAATDATGTIVIATTDARSKDSAFEHRRLSMTGGVQPDNGNARSRRRRGEGVVREAVGGRNQRGIPRGRRAEHASPRGEDGDAELPDRQRRAPKGQRVDTARGGRGV